MALSITYPTLATVDQARVDRLKELLTAVLQGYNPSIDLRRGVVHDQVLHPRALLAAVTEEGVLNALAATSLSDLVADPAVGDSESVNRVLGNYRLTRTPAAKATGPVAIVVSALSPVVVAAGTVITVSGLTFTADRAYAARTDISQVTGPGDVLLVQVTGGYRFDVTVTAQVAGASGNVRRGTMATLTQNPPGFVKAYTDADFTGGANEESNGDLLGRLASGLAARAWSNRPSIEAAMRAHVETVDGVSTEPFANIGAVSIVGFGDQEMTRDQHSLFPVSGGGRADLYVRTADTYTTTRLTVTAFLTSKTGPTGTWQFGLGKDAVPGFYEVTKITLPGGDPASEGWVTLSDVRSKDVSDPGWKPDLPTQQDVTYTRYQTSVIQFVDTVTNVSAVSLGATKSYDVFVTGVPLIADLQGFWNLVENRPTAGDVLVRAPVPCFTGVSLTLQVEAGTTVDVHAVQTAVSELINGTGFTGKISASSISKVLHADIDGLSTVSGYVFTGRIRRTDNTISNISGTDGLTIPTDASGGTGTKTTLFFTIPDAVSVAVMVLDSP